MKAFVLDQFGSAPHVRTDLPAPTPGENDILIRVHASSVNPVDVHLAAGALKEMVDHEFPVTIGRDFAGVVEEIGSGVSRYRAGDEVFGFLPLANPAVHGGSWAEMITVPEDNFVAPRPQSLDLATAGAAPLAGITALAAADALQLSQGEAVLVVGATGGVGSIFIQIAAAARATVIAPALAADHDYLRTLGATELIDRDADVASAVRAAHPEGVDAILDLANFAPDTFVLKPGGRLASALGAAGEGLQRFNLMAQATPENLRRLSELIDDGIVRVPIQQTYPLDQSAEAMQTQRTTHTQGKVALTIT